MERRARGGPQRSQRERAEKPRRARSRREDREAERAADTADAEGHQTDRPSRYGGTPGYTEMLRDFSPPVMPIATRGLRMELAAATYEVATLGERVLGRCGRPKAPRLIMPACCQLREHPIGRSDELGLAAGLQPACCAYHNVASAGHYSRVPAVSRCACARMLAVGSGSEGAEGAVGEAVAADAAGAPGAATSARVAASPASAGSSVGAGCRKSGEVWANRS